MNCNMDEKCFAHSYHDHECTHFMGLLNNDKPAIRDISDFYSDETEMVASLPECLQACKNIPECVQGTYRNHMCTFWGI